MRVEDFFIRENEVGFDSEPDYSRAADFVSAAEAFSRCTYQSVYIIDYYRQNFLYVSDNPILLCGLSPEKVMELGYRFYFDVVPEEDLKLLVLINRAGFEFYDRLPVDERCQWFITYDFHIMSRGRKLLINHKLTPLVLGPAGRIWLALCVVSASSHITPGHIEMHRDGSVECFQFNVSSRKWVKKPVPVLTEREKQLIMLSSRGYTMTEIADKMCLAPVTVKKERIRLYDRLGVTNISEAILMAINGGLL